MERDSKGRFKKGNKWASKGGRARASKLSSREREEIARKGWRALVSQRFYGDSIAQGEYLGALGAWASDQVYPAWMKVFRHPGSIEEFMESYRARQQGLDALTLEKVEALSF